jgi:hypothetical protein
LHEGVFDLVECLLVALLPNEISGMSAFQRKEWFRDGCKMWNEFRKIVAEAKKPL